MIRSLVPLALLLLARPLLAANLPHEFTITPQKITEAPQYLTTVDVSDATCAAVSDSLGLLVMGRKGKDEKHLAVYKLDQKGLPSGEPAWITLPRPELLVQKGKANYALGLLFHPKLPLLYVWQDIEGPPLAKEKNPDMADFLEFDHLLVYAIKDGALELVQTGSRGMGFRCGVTAGTLGFDYGAKNLFVPNAIGETWDEAAIAFYALDEEGMPGDAPEASNDQPAKPVKNLTISRSGKALKPVAVPRRLRTGRYFPSGTGWFGAPEETLMGGFSGCMMFDFHNGSLRQSWFGVPEQSGSCSLAVHPTLPALYLSMAGNSHLYQVAQVNGHVTLLPQIAIVTGAVFQGLPVVMTQQGRLAVTEAKAIHFLQLAADGKLTDQDEQLNFPAAVGRGMTYSEKTGRLYVSLEKQN